MTKQLSGTEIVGKLRQADVHLAQGKTSLALSFEPSTIVDYVDVAPITVTEKFET